ncbi:MAG: phosphopantetheine-binding protein, partial [Actinocrinis sp.]
RAVVCLDYQDAVAALGDPSRWIDGETRRRDPRVRVVAQGPASDPWWARLARAAATPHRESLPFAGDHAATGPDSADRDAALAVLSRALTRLGVRVVEQADSSAGIETVLAAPGDESESADVWVLTTLARLWQTGAAIDWPALYGSDSRYAGDARRVELPTYPFQRRRYWLDASPAAEQDQTSDAAGWRRSALPVDDLDARLRAAGPWLMLIGEECGQALAERLVLAGAEVFVARPGEGFREQDSGELTVSPADPGALSELLRTMLVVPRTIVHALSLASPAARGLERFEAEQVRGVRGAVALARALAEYESAFAEHGEEPPAIDVTLLTSAAVSVTGADPEHPEHAALAALASSIDQTGGGMVACRHIDAADDADIDLVLAASICRNEGPRAVRGTESWLLRGPETPTPRDASALAVTARSASSSPSATSSNTDTGANNGGLRPRPALATAFVEPSAGTEETVARLWAQALGLERVGVDDNFFELGGRSMTAVQLAQRVGAELGAALPVTALIEQPTVRLLCAGLAPEAARNIQTAQTSQGGNP